MYQRNLVDLIERSAHLQHRATTVVDELIGRIDFAGMRVLDHRRARRR
jgi:hypothetical protein